MMNTPENTDTNPTNLNEEAIADSEATTGFPEKVTSAAPTILITYAPVGSGHKTAAQAVAAALERMRDSGEIPYEGATPLPKDLKIQLVDMFKYGLVDLDGDKMASGFTGVTRPFYDVTWRYAFTGRILWGGGTCITHIYFRKFIKFISDMKPLAVISTHMIGANAACGARAITGQTFPVISVPTDYETEGLWPHLYSDAFCVANTAMAETLRARKVPDENIFTTGIPTRTDFLKPNQYEAAKNEFGLPLDKKIILILAGATLPMPYKNMRELIHKALPYFSRYRDKFHFVIVSGKDFEYEASTKAFINELGMTNITVFGFVDKIAELMSLADLIICKAGGLTVTECLCSGTPMILIGKAYGQEKCNVRMLTAHGAALHATTARELIRALDHFDRDPRYLEAMAFNGRMMRKPDAAHDVVVATMKVLDRKKKTTMKPLTKKGKRRAFIKPYVGYRPARVR